MRGAREGNRPRRYRRGVLTGEVQFVFGKGSSFCTHFIVMHPIPLSRDCASRADVYDGRRSTPSYAATRRHTSERQARMAKDRQLVFRLDNDLAEVLEDSSTKLARSRAVILCTGMMLFAELSPEKQAQAVMRYLSREKDRGGKRA